MGNKKGAAPHCGMAPDRLIIAGTLRYGSEGLGYALKMENFLPIGVNY
jgi:hypothetical protein